MKAEMVVDMGQQKTAKLSRFSSRHPARRVTRSLLKRDKYV